MYIYIYLIRIETIYILYYIILYYITQHYILLYYKIKLYKLLSLCISYVLKLLIFIVLINNIHS